MIACHYQKIEVDKTCHLNNIDILRYFEYIKLNRLLKRGVKFATNHNLYRGYSLVRYC